MRGVLVIPSVAEAFAGEWAAAQAALASGDWARAVHHLERAHILGQRRTGPHVRSHVGMLALAWQRRDAGEVLGQLVRIVAAALFSRVWVPEGNTGGTDVSTVQPMLVPADLRAILEADRAR